MSTQNADVPYPTISFRQDGTWGYPVPHLMAMQYVATNAPAEGIDSEINFFFTSESVRIKGEGLRILWDKLVMELPELIAVDTFKTDAGTYIVRELEIVRPGVSKA